MTSANTQKKSTTYKILVQIVRRLYNPQVAMAYRETLDNDPDPLRPILKNNLTIYAEDSLLEIVLKLLIFYLVDCRLWVSPLTPNWWEMRSESFKPQLAISFRPVGTRKRFAFADYAHNPTLHIPHYNGDHNPQIPSYTIGRYSARYYLKDRTYICVNASTKEEAIAVVAKLASYTLESKRIAGDILDNIGDAKRAKKPKEDGVKIEPYKGEYFTGGKDGYKSLVKIHL